MMLSFKSHQVIFKACGSSVNSDAVVDGLVLGCLGIIYF